MISTGFLMCLSYHVDNIYLQVFSLHFSVKLKNAKFGSKLLLLPYLTYSTAESFRQWNQFGTDK